MVLPTTGPLSFTAIVGEFGGTVPHSLSEYYGKATGIPASGPIKFSDFYGASNNPLAPTWTTAADLGTKGINASFAYNLVATSDSPITAYAITSSPGFGTLSALQGNKTVNLTGTTTGTIGTVSWTITATDTENQSTARTFTLTITSTAPSWSTASSLGTYSVGGYFNIQLVATSDSPITAYAITSSPGFGLLSALQADKTVYLSGTVPAGMVGTKSWTITATDTENQSTARVFSITVNSSSPTWSSGSYLGAFNTYSYFNVNLRAYSDSSISNYQLMSAPFGSLGGLMGDRSVYFSGYTQGEGYSYFTIRAYDQEAQYTDQQFYMYVTPPHFVPYWPFSNPISIGTYSRGSYVYTSLVAQGRPEPTHIGYYMTWLQVGSNGAIYGSVPWDVEPITYYFEMDAYNYLGYAGRLTVYISIV